MKEQLLGMGLMIVITYLLLRLRDFFLRSERTAHGGKTGPYWRTARNRALAGTWALTGNSPAEVNISHSLRWKNDARR
jgi:hypothetical protein